MSYRAIHNARFSILDKVADLILDNAWSWPTDWNTRYPPLANINVPQLNEHADVLRWKDADGMFRPFSVSLAWNTIRERRDVVQCSYIVWSRHCIPRHAAHMWLVMKRRLKTQDRLRPWDVGEDVDLPSLRCPLCKVEQDSHDHLFFACNFSSQVWNVVVNKADLPIGSHIWSDIWGWILSIARKNNAICIVGRLILAASSYYIWQERNNRIHVNGASSARSVEQVASVILVGIYNPTILDIVRLKLEIIKFKRNARVAKLKTTWNLPAD
ncbi:reverse transcriptase domain, reverse transcriptase zinc-binding domain protein [Tanacetum coccineum]